MRKRIECHHHRQFHDKNGKCGDSKKVGKMLNLCAALPWVAEAVADLHPFGPHLVHNRYMQVIEDHGFGEAGRLKLEIIILLDRFVFYFNLEFEQVD